MPRPSVPTANDTSDASRVTPMWRASQVLTPVWMGMIAPTTTARRTATSVTWRPARQSRRAPSPFGEAAVVVAPDRVGPTRPRGRSLAYSPLVDLDAQPWTGQAGDRSVGVVEHARVDEVVQHLGADVVVDADALLLDHVAGGAEADLQRRGEADRAERTVGASSAPYVSASAAILRTSVMPPA